MSLSLSHIGELVGAIEVETDDLWVQEAVVE
jgi:hypothetical protein